MLFSFLTQQHKKLLTCQILPTLAKRPFKQSLDTKWGGRLFSTAQTVMLTEHNLQCNKPVQPSCCQKAEPGITAETKLYIFSTARAPHFRFEARWLEKTKKKKVFAVTAQAVRVESNNSFLSIRFLLAVWNQHISIKPLVHGFVVWRGARMLHMLTSLSLSSPQNLPALTRSHCNDFWRRGTKDTKPKPNANRTRLSSVHCVLGASTRSQYRKWWEAREHPKGEAGGRAWCYWRQVCQLLPATWPTGHRTVSESPLRANLQVLIPSIAATRHPHGCQHIWEHKAGPNPAHFPQPPPTEKTGVIRVTDTEDKEDGVGKASQRGQRRGSSRLVQRKNMQQSHNMEWITGFFSDSDETPGKGHEKHSCLDNVWGVLVSYLSFAFHAVFVGSESREAWEAA